MSSTERITVHNLADLKNTSDDAIPNYLNSLRFKQSHRLIDVRLAVGYSAFVVAGLCFAWDYKFGFDKTKYYTAAAVVLYTLLNGVLTYWMSIVEKGTVYEGTAPSGEKINIVTMTKKYVPVYNMTVTLTGKKGNRQTIKISRPFTEWFDEQGYFVAPPFQQMLASGVPLIGKIDPKRVKSVSQEILDASPEVLDAILAASSASAVGSSTAAEASAKKASKRRKGQ